MYDKNSLQLNSFPHTSHFNFFPCFIECVRNPLANLKVFPQSSHLCFSILVLSLCSLSAVGSSLTLISFSSKSESLPFTSTPNSISSISFNSIVKIKSQAKFVYLPIYLYHIVELQQFELFHSLCY